MPVNNFLLNMLRPHSNHTTTYLHHISWLESEHASRDGLRDTLLQQYKLYYIEPQTLLL